MKHFNKAEFILAVIVAALFISPTWASAGGRWTRDGFPDDRWERRYPRFVDRDGDGVGARLDCDDNDKFIWQRIPGEIDGDYDGYVDEQRPGMGCVGDAQQYNGRTYYYYPGRIHDYQRVYYDHVWLPESQILGYSDRFPADAGLH